MFHPVPGRWGWGQCGSGCNTSVGGGKVMVVAVRPGRMVRRVVPGRAVDAVKDYLDVWRVENRMDDEALRATIRTAVAGGGILVDVGAYRGHILAAAVQVAPRVGHVAVEPLAQNAAEIAAAFPGVVVHACAAGRDVRAETFYVNAQATRSSLDEVAGTVDSVVVEVRPVDMLVGDDVDVRVVKVDVEGHELEVFDGMAGLVDRCRPVIAFEHGSPDGSRNEDTALLFDWLVGRGYRVCPARGGPVDAAGFATLVASGGAWNWIAYP